MEGLEPNISVLNVNSGSNSISIIIIIIIIVKSRWFLHEDNISMGIP